MGIGLLIYMMVTKESKQWNGANRAISIGKQHTDCPKALLQYCRVAIYVGGAWSWGERIWDRDSGLDVLELECLDGRQDTVSHASG